MNIEQLLKQSAEALQGPLEARLIELGVMPNSHPANVEQDKVLRIKGTSQPVKVQRVYFDHQQAFRTSIEFHGVDADWEVGHSFIVCLSDGRSASLTERELADTAAGWGGFLGHGERKPRTYHWLPK